MLRQISIDAARQAKREPGVADVHLCSLEALDEMPAEDTEILEGDEEGVVRRNSLGPVEIRTSDAGEVTGVLFRRCLRVFDSDGRFDPLFDDDDRELIECDNAVLAIGQSVDLRFVDAERDGLEITDRGFIACDPGSGRTNAPDVFVAGDLATGPRLLIDAVASGKAVARSVYQALTGRSITHRDVELHLAMRDYEREPGYEHQPRVDIPTNPVSQRVRSHVAPVEIRFSEPQARCEAGRCLDCGVNTIFDGPKCILCGGCVDVCPERCLRIVSVNRLGSDGELGEAVDRQLDETLAEDASAIIKDETICIRCGLCADRCPTGAITMERFHFEEIPACLMR